MEEAPKKSSTMPILMAVLALVIGLAIGFGVTKAMDNNNDDTSSSDTKMSTTTPTSATKAADLRANLVTLGVEHMQLTDSAVAAALDGSADAKALDTALNSNGTDIGAAVGSIYGADAQKTFDSVWQLHLDQFVNYAVADKGGNTAAKQAALSAIDSQYTKPLAQYLAKANPNLPEAALESALRDHVNMTAQMIDYHVAGNYAMEQSELKMASDHLNGLFSTLAGGIVKQYPSKF